MQVKGFNNKTDSHFLFLVCGKTESLGTVA